MDKIRITGGNKMNGILPISGAKNAALPLMITSLLTKETLQLENVPRLADVATLNRILGNHGVDIATHGKRSLEHDDYGQTISYTARNIVDTTAPYEMVSKMRASFWVLAPLVARMGEAKVSLPGGCAIGTRPVDLHLSALETLGVDITLDGGYVIAKAPKGLTGGHIVFPKISVGATHQALMASVLANGETRIDGAACEPEVSDVANCLVKMGAKIDGIGTPHLTIQGVSALNGAKHQVVADRIEAGTFAMAVAMAGGNVLLKNAHPETLVATIDILRKVGVKITEQNDGIRVERNPEAELKSVDTTTEPHPGFPTDLQAQFMALMTRANGISKIRETIFENRFMHVPELARMGAQITVEGDTAIVQGVDELRGAPVQATDLRASVSLAIGALVAEGDTDLHQIHHLDRGFENLEGKFRNVGVNIERVSAYT